MTTPNKNPRALRVYSCEGDDNSYSFTLNLSFEPTHFRVAQIAYVQDSTNAVDNFVTNFGLYCPDLSNDILCMFGQSAVSGMTNQLPNVYMQTNVKPNNTITFRVDESLGSANGADSILQFVIEYVKVD